MTCCPTCGRARGAYGLTPQMQKLLAVLHWHRETFGVFPTFEELLAPMGLRSKSGLHALMKALEERGYIARLPNKPRAIVFLDLQETAA